MLISRDKDKYRLLIENMPDAFAYHRIVTGRQGEPADYIFLEVNAAFEEMTGLKREKIINKKVTEVFPDIEKSDFDWIGTYGQVALSGEPIRFESFSEPLGRWHDIRAYSDAPGFFGVFFHDITERKQSEETLRESEIFSRAVMDHLPIGLAVNSVDPEVNFTYMNDNFSKIYHTTRDALFDQDAFWDVVYEDPQFRSEIKQRVLKDCASGDPEKMWWKDIPITRNGQIVAYISAGNIPISENNLMISTVLDVTNRVKTEQALQESETRFQRMLKVIPDMVSVHDPEMNIAYSNWKGFAAVPAEKQILNTKCYKTYRGYDQICPDCQAVQVLKSKKAFQEEVELSEDYWIDLRVIPIFNNSGEVEYFIEWVRDISGLKIIEKELKGLNINLERKVDERTAQLEAVNRELDAFTHSASHDLRGPLNRISGFSEALLEDCIDQLDPQNRHYLQRINSSCEHMKQLIDDLLKLSRVSQMQISREPVELSALVNINIIELQAREPDRQVEKVVAPGLVAVGDTALLRIALQNLLSNAWKYSAGEEKARIEFGSTVREGKVIYYIKDNGTGFDMKHAEKLFAAFQRLHSEQEFAGTGIGLSIVSRIISRHGGEVWAEGEKGKGACFFFTLP